MVERTRRFEVGGFSELLRLYTEGLYDRFKELHISTVAGWNAVIGGSGSRLFTPLWMSLKTGTTPASSARIFRSVFGLNSGDISRVYVDWRKRLEWEFTIARENSDPEATARIQLKETSAEGALAQRGIGLEIANYTVRGEGYGTSRGTVDLGTIPDNRLWHVKMVLEGNRLEFWVNRVLQGVLTGDSVPQVQGTATGYVVITVRNGPTGGVDFSLVVGDLRVVQEW